MSDPASVVRKQRFYDNGVQKGRKHGKISQDAIEVSNIIMRDFEGLPADAKIVPNRQGVQSPRALVTEPLAEDIRMYNANIELWYVRKEFGNYNKKKWNTVASLLTMDVSEIPVKTVIKVMRKNGSVIWCSEAGRS